MSGLLAWLSSALLLLGASIGLVGAIGGEPMIESGAVGVASVVCCGLPWWIRLGVPRGRRRA